MKNYKFLVKPLFYIFALLFSCWMVLEIEKFHARPADPALLQVISDYESGKIDSTGLRTRLKGWLGNTEEMYVLTKEE